LWRVLSIALLLLLSLIPAGAAVAQTETPPSVETTATAEAAATAETMPSVEVGTGEATATAEATTEFDPPAGSSETPTATPTAPFIPDPRFGVIESYDEPAAAGRLGVGWTRARFQWAEVQPTGPDDWEPPLSDEELAAELAAGREVVGLLIGVPRWARDRDGLPRGLALPPDDPDNTWAVFVGDVVARYAGRIDRWIIWNEPDIDDPDAPGHTWDGTIEQFFQLQRTAYLATHAANPDAVVHLGAFTYFWDPAYFDRFLDLAAADPGAAANNHYFDVATAHLYFQPNAVYNVLHAFRRVLDAHGLDHPIWLVETNAPPMNDPYWEVENWTLAVDLNEQAAFMPQAIANALAAGVERVAVYKLRDTAGDRAANPEPFGLIRWDNSRRPAFDTYRIALRLMAGTTTAERQRWDAVGQVRLAQPGQSTTVLFARLPDSQTVRVPATADTADWIDMWGKRETITSEDGYFTVRLPGALCLQTIADYCMIGGTTYYLVQQNDRRPPTAEPPTATPAIVEASVALTATPTPGLTATAARAAPSDSTPTAIVVAAAPLVPEQEAAAGVVATTPVEPPSDAATGRSTNGDTSEQPTGYTGLILLGAGLALGVGLTGLAFRRRGG
jgi:hypothetical protein